MYVRNALSGVFQPLGEQAYTYVQRTFVHTHACTRMECFLRVAAPLLHAIVSYIVVTLYTPVSLSRYLRSRLDAYPSHPVSINFCRRMSVIRHRYVPVIRKQIDRTHARTHCASTYARTHARIRRTFSGITIFFPFIQSRSRRDQRECIRDSAVLISEL